MVSRGIALRRIEGGVGTAVWVLSVCVAQNLDVFGERTLFAFLESQKRLTSHY